MKNWLIYIVPILTYSCGKDSACSKPKGDIVTQEKSLDSFSGIQVLENLNVIWEESNDYEAIITTGENFIDQITFTQEDGLLTISNENSCTWLRDDIKEVDIVIKAPKLEKIIMRGDGSISSEDTIKNKVKIQSFVNQGSLSFVIKNDSVNVELESGSVDLTLAGTSDYLYLYTVGYGHVLAKNLITQTTHISNNSWTFNEIHAQQKLIIEHYTEGDIYYWGNPPVVVQTGGNGKGKIEAK